MGEKQVVTTAAPSSCGGITNLQGKKNLPGWTCQWVFSDMLPFLVSTLFHEGVNASGDICPFRPLHGPRWWPNWVLGSRAGVGNFLWKCFSCWEARGTGLNISEDVSLCCVFLSQLLNLSGLQGPPLQGSSSEGRWGQCVLKTVKLCCKALGLFISF